MKNLALVAGFNTI